MLLLCFCSTMSLTDWRGGDEGGKEDEGDNKRRPRETKKERQFTSKAEESDRLWRLEMREKGGKNKIRQRGACKREIRRMGERMR